MSEIIDMQSYVKRGPDRIARKLIDQPPCKLVTLEKKSVLMIEYQDARNYLTDLMIKNWTGNPLTDVDHINAGNALKRMDAAMRELMRI